MTLRTNPAYAHIAYRKAILGRTIQFLSDNFLALSADEPKDVILCEDVFREDSEVDIRSIEEYIEELQQEEESLRLELAKFDFVKKDEHEGFRGKKKEAGGAPGQQAGAEEGRKGGRSRKRAGGRQASS